MSLWHMLENVTPAFWDIDVDPSETYGVAMSPNDAYRWIVQAHEDRHGEVWGVLGQARDPRTGRWRTVIEMKEANAYEATKTVGAFMRDLVGRTSEEPPERGLFDELG